MEEPNTRHTRSSSQPSTAVQREHRRLARQQRHARARERLSRIDAAERIYIDAAVAIEAADHDLAEVIAAPERRVQAARTRTEEKIGEHQRRQAHAAAAIRAEQCSISEVAEILQISPKQVRDLLRTTDTDTDFSARDIEQDPADSRVGQQPPSIDTESSEPWQGEPKGAAVQADSGETIQTVTDFATPQQWSST
jgi:predicted HTH domain antitoxin